MARNSARGSYNTWRPTAYGNCPHCSKDIAPRCPHCNKRGKLIKDRGERDGITYFTCSSCGKKSKGARV